MPDAPLATFSKRSGQILERVEPSARWRHWPRGATRPSRRAGPSGRAELEAAGTDPWQEALHAAQEPDPSRAHEADHTEREALALFDPPEIAGDAPVARAASALFRHESVLSRAALLQAALDEASLRGLGIEAVEVEFTGLERDGRLMPLSTVALDPGQNQSLVHGAMSECAAVQPGWPARTRAPACWPSAAASRPRSSANGANADPTIARTARRGPRAAVARAG